MSQSITDSQAVTQYKGVVEGELRNHGKYAHLNDDLEQEGMIALVKAARTWDPSQGAKFGSFATRLVRNAMIDFVRSQKSDCVSLDQEFDGGLRGDDLVSGMQRTATVGCSLHDALGEPATQEANLLERERLAILNESIELLSPAQRCLIAGQVEGRSAAQVGNERGVHRSTAVQSLRRALPTLRAHLKASGAFDDR